MPDTSGTLLPARSGIEEGLALWNLFPGDLWSVKAAFDEAGFARCDKLISRAFDDGVLLPKEPGPYKRLAAYALGVQYFSPYVWPTGCAPELWEPRIAVWTLANLGRMVLANTNPPLPPVRFPTLHIQIEIVAHLRSIHTSLQRRSSPVEIDTFAERVTQLGLIFEGVAYASYPNADRLAKFRPLAAACVVNGSISDPVSVDRYFLSRRFYSLDDKAH